MQYLIDEPTPFDTLKSWEEFLRELRKLDQSNPEVKDAVANAESHIERMKR
jgi:hypothetical protein